MTNTHKLSSAVGPFLSQFKHAKLQMQRRSPTIHESVEKKNSKAMNRGDITRSVLSANPKGYIAVLVGSVVNNEVLLFNIAISL